MRSLLEIAPRILEVYPRSFYTSDTLKEQFHLNLHARDDAFHALCLGILYAFPIYPAVADATLAAMRTKESRALFETNVLADAYRAHLRPLAHRIQLQRISVVLPKQFALIETSYRRVPRIVLLSIAKAAAKVEEETGGDVTRLYELCGYDGRAVVRRLRSWRVRLDIKAFWLCREMRVQKAWIDARGEPISGDVCCVVDIQVQRALQHLRCYNSHFDAFAHSRLIWQAFGELYDFPLLWLARQYLGRRPVGSCPIEACGCSLL